MIRRSGVSCPEPDALTTTNQRPPCGVLEQRRAGIAKLVAFERLSDRVRDPSRDFGSSAGTTLDMQVASGVAGSFRHRYQSESAFCDSQWVEPAAVVFN